MKGFRTAALAAALVGTAACGGGGSKETVWTCKAPDAASGDGGTATAQPDFLSQLGCLSDFEGLASEPIDATIPGARSGKVVLDQSDGDALYFQNSKRYQIHYQFAKKFLSGLGHPLVGSLSEFSAKEYSSIERRFILASVTYYEKPDLWTLEFAPYDTANAEMIERLFNAVKKNAFFGSKLVVHTTSEAQAAVAAGLPATVPIKTTDDIFAATDYQPLNLATAIGKLKFYKAAELETTYLGYRDIVVLDHVPNDISVVAGMITEEFQTPLSHVNVLAQNRHTPNMGLRRATTNETLRGLENTWVKLVVGAQQYTITPVYQEEADAWWEANKPPKIELPAVDLTVKDLRNVEALVVEDPAAPQKLKDQIQTAILAFGTKASNYGILANTPGVPIRKAFAIPVFYYVQFMMQNGFFAEVDALLADADFNTKPEVRDAKLADLRSRIALAPVDPAFSNLLRAKLAADYPGQTMRFRTSTNAEDLDGFPCAGCYDSQTGDPSYWEESLLVAIKKAWAGVWFFRTFEERAYHSIDHKTVAMGLLVHHNFPDEAANGVTLTANPFDPAGIDQPAFYVNVQKGGEAEVVHPPAGITSDAFLYFYYTLPNRPITYLAHSNLILPGETVLNTAQIIQLGTALDAIHARFSFAYGPNAAQANTGFYAMDCEFKYSNEDDPSKPPTLWVKQARPNNGRGQ